MQAGVRPLPTLLCAGKGVSRNGEGPRVLTGLPLDILFLTLLPPFHLGLRQRCKASFPETVPSASS